jgi:hypothetical protein
LQQSGYPKGESGAAPGTERRFQPSGDRLQTKFALALFSTFRAFEGSIPENEFSPKDIGLRQMTLQANRQSLGSGKRNR